MAGGAHAGLVEAAATCERTLRAFADDYPRAVEAPFASALLLAVAAMQTAAASLDTGPPRRETALLLAGRLAREAAEAARRHGHQAALAPCIEACERAAALCDDALRDQV